MGINGFMLIFKYVICIFAGAMIRLFKVKEKQKELAENANGGVPIKKQTAGELRLHKGLFFTCLLVN